MTSTDTISTILNLLPPGHPWGHRLIHLETVDSTNSYAKRLAQQGAPSGTVVIADHQSGGRGRLGRSFSSPAGAGLYFSLILRPNCAAESLMHLTCAVGVAACEAVQTACGLLPDIKWTNDLVVGKQKLGGILTELGISSVNKAVEYAIIGIGINCNQSIEDFPPDIRAIATSLHLCGYECDRCALAAALIEQLFKLEGSLLTQRPQIMAAYAKRCITIGQEISIVRADVVQHAKALDVDENGALIVQFSDGSRGHVDCGEVSIRGMYGYL